MHGEKVSRQKSAEGELKEKIPSEFAITSWIWPTGGHGSPRQAWRRRTGWSRRTKSKKPQRARVSVFLHQADSFERSQGEKGEAGSDGVDGAQGVKGEKAGALTTHEAERVAAAAPDCRLSSWCRVRRVSQDSRDSKVRPGMPGCLGRREQQDLRDCAETQDPRWSISGSELNSFWL